jgi:pre-rRNA-processing protein TSR4
MGGKGAGNAPMFGLGAQIFGAPPSVCQCVRPRLGNFGPDQCPGISKEEADESGKQKPKEEQGDEAEDKTDNDDDESTDEELLTALAATSISESAWKSAPSYPPLYLSTVSEYLPPPPKPRLPKGVQVEDLGEDDKKDKDISWAKETYEDSLEVDQVFERFMNRVKHEGEQCVRFV